MPWPAPNDYRDAIQSPKVCFNDPELKSGRVQEDATGLPRPISGRFAVVYNMQCGSRNFAVRCFQSDVPDQQERYNAISEHLKKTRLPYTVDFDFQQKGIRIHGAWYPIVKMEWVEGEPLHSFIEKNVRNAPTLIRLASDWLTMSASLTSAHVAHGDLQDGNVLVVNGELKLIDYDGMYVPALAGKASNESGARNYQHPRRTGNDYGLSLDNFSHWVIYTSLVAISIDPSLWSMMKAGDECLLFRQGDYETPEASSALNTLRRHSDSRLQALGDLLLDIWRLPVQSVPAIGLSNSLGIQSTPYGVAQGVEIQDKPWWQDHVVEDQPTTYPRPIDNPFLAKRDLRWLVELSTVAPPPLNFQIPSKMTRLVVVAALLTGILTPVFGNVKADILVEPAMFATCALLSLRQYRRDPVFATLASTLHTSDAAAACVDALKIEWEAHLQEWERLEQLRLSDLKPLSDQRIQADRNAESERRDSQVTLDHELDEMGTAMAAQIEAIERRLIEIHAQRVTIVEKRNQEDAQASLRAEAAIATLQGVFLVAEQQWKQAQAVASALQNSLALERDAEHKQLRGYVNAEVSRRNAEVRNLTAVFNRSIEDIERQRQALHTRVQREQDYALVERNRQTASATRDLEETQQALKMLDAQYKIDAAQVRAALNGLHKLEIDELQAQLTISQREHRETYLSNQHISTAAISGLTANHIKNLNARGYVNARDINWDVAAVTGIGPIKARFIWDWADKQARLAQSTLLESLPQSVREQIIQKYRSQRGVLEDRLHSITMRYEHNTAALREQLEFRESVFTVESAQPESEYRSILVEIESYFDDHQSEFASKEVRVRSEHEDRISALYAEIASLQESLASGVTANGHLARSEKAISEELIHANNEFTNTRNETTAKIADHEKDLNRQRFKNWQCFQEEDGSLAQQERKMLSEKEQILNTGAIREAHTKKQARERTDKQILKSSQDRENLRLQEAKIAATHVNSFDAWQADSNQLRKQIGAALESHASAKREHGRFGDLSFRKYLQKFLNIRT